MNAKDGDSTVDALSIVVKHYDKDGPYSPTVHTAEGQVAEQMSVGSSDFMTLIIAQPPSPMPVGIMIKPESKVVATISGKGATGTLEFTDWADRSKTTLGASGTLTIPAHGYRVLVR